MIPPLGVRTCIVSLALALAAGAASAQEVPGNAELLERVKRLEEELRRLAAAKEAKDERAAKAPEAKAPGAKTQDGVKDVPKEAKEAKDGAPQGLILELPFSSKVRLSGQVRLRGEYRDLADYRIPGTFGRALNDESSEGSDFVLLRTRLALEFQVMERLRALVELQDSRTFGDAAVNVDEASLHLRQGFIELQRPFDIPLWVLAGRHEVPTFGDGRMFSPLDFSNVSRSWDGFQVSYKLGADEKGEGAKLVATGFAANVREGQIFSLDGDENDDFWYSGACVSLRFVPDHELDAYLFWRHQSDRVFAREVGARLGDRKDFSGGLRFAGKALVFKYSGELVYQWGDQAGDRIQAWAAATRNALVLELEKDFLLEVTGEYAYASGDRDRADGTVHRFDPILPYGHFFHGHMDLVLWSNIHAGMVGLKLEPQKGLSFHADMHGFWLDKRKDAWLSLNKTPIRSDATGRASSQLGAELDLYFKWKLWKRLSFVGGYSHFWPGAYVRDTGRGTRGARTGDQDWVHLQAQLDF